MPPTDTAFFQYLVAAIGAVWASVNTIIACAKIINERRDWVLTGNDGKNNLSMRHRRLMIYCDWLPMVAACIGACLIYSMIILVIVSRSGLSGYVYWICLSCALVPGVAAVGLAVGSCFEYRVMRGILTSGSDPSFTVKPSFRVPRRQHRDDRA